MYYIFGKKMTIIIVLENEKLILINPVYIHNPVKCECKK